MPRRSGSPRMSGAIRAWRALLEPYPAEQHTAEFRGIGQPMTVVKIGARDRCRVEAADAPRVKPGAQGAPPRRRPRWSRTRPCQSSAPATATNSSSTTSVLGDPSANSGQAT